MPIDYTKRPEAASAPLGSGSSPVAEQFPAPTPTPARPPLSSPAPSAPAGTAAAVRATFLRDAEPNAEVAIAAAALLPATEQPLLSCRTGRLEISGWVAHVPTVLITNEHLIVVKERLLRGGVKLAKHIKLVEISSAGVGPLLGVGPTWEVSLRLRYQVVSIYFDSPPAAEEFERVLRGAVEQALLAARDPDFAELQRALSMSRSQPTGERGLIAEEVPDEVARMRALFDQGNLRRVWDRRLQLGYGVPSERVPGDALFWVNALPAIAALRLGLKEHPLVASCCGLAEQAHDRSDAAQAAAVAEFNRLFFG